MGRSLLILVVWLVAPVVAWGQTADVARILARYQELRPSDAELSMYRLDWAPSLEEGLRRAAREGRAVLLIIIHAKYGDIATGHC